METFKVWQYSEEMRKNTSVCDIKIAVKFAFWRIDLI